MKTFPLRSKLAWTMLVLALVPLLLQAVTNRRLMNKLLEQERESSLVIYDMLLDVTGQGFYQGELYQLKQTLKIASLLRPTQTAADLEQTYSDLNDLGLTYADCQIFLAANGVITAATGSTNLSPQDFENVLNNEVDPLLPEIMGEDAASDLSDLLLTTEDFSVYHDSEEAPFLLAWVPLDETNRLGMFVPSGDSQLIIFALKGLLQDMRSESERTIDQTLRQGVLALALLALILTVAVMLSSYRLSLVLSRPVEQRAKQQQDLLSAAEEENVQLEALNRRKSEFLSNISHELKTPLSVISSHLQTGNDGLSEGETPDKQEHRVQLVTSEVERLALLVDQLLDVSRIDEGRLSFNMASESILEIIQSTLDVYYPVYSKNHNSLLLTHDSANPLVYCDRMRITQVLVNLISNASRHMRNGEIKIAVNRVDDHALISVSDNGSGIEPERLDTVFERFESSGKGETGTGLGLYICRYIIEEHGGTIGIESEVGKGTTVSFTLPSNPVS